MKSVALSRRAIRSLQDISDWTLEAFGDRQMVRYNKVLSVRMRALATGAIHGRNCSAHFDPNVSEDLLFISAGSHFIIFIETATDFLIIDFIHQSADIGGRLGGPQS